MTAQFLNIDEAAALRDEVEGLRQSAYEPEIQYARRFREVADVAYPVAIRNADQDRLLVKYFTKGLKSDAMARKLVEEINPANLNVAINSIAAISERKHAYSRLGRHEEPMEVGALAKPMAPPPSTPASTTRPIDSLCCTIEKLATKVAKLEASAKSSSTNKSRNKRSGWEQSSGSQTRRAPPRGPQSRGPAWDENGRPRCFQCNQFGHFARECRKQQPTQSGNY